MRNIIIKAQNMLVHTIKATANEFIHYNVNGDDYWLPYIGSVAIKWDKIIYVGENSIF